MKAVYVLVGLVILGVVAFVLFGSKDTTEQPSDANPSVEMGQTVPGNSEVEEMIVEEESMSDEDDTEDEATGEVKEFTIDSFSFGYSETEIRVNQGDTVTINLTNSNGFHDWVVDEFEAATEKIREGETTSVTFVADQAGTFEYYCSVGSHRAQGMVGNLIVE